MAAKKKTTATEGPIGSGDRGPVGHTGTPGPTGPGPDANKVAVLTTNIGEPLVIRSNPTEAEVKGFVEEHNRRYQAGEAGGPSGTPPVQILGAAFYPSEDDAQDDSKATKISL